MALVSTLLRQDGTILRTYRNLKNGNITYTLRSEIAGKGIAVKAVKCDELGNPYKIIDAAKNRYDVYIKAKDGSTIMQNKGKNVSFPNLIFNTVCARIFGK